MPKITAPTVVEHRIHQRRALLDAAEAIIGDEGVAGVTPRSVGERAGLSRSSFYEYFPSRDDLLAAIAVQAFDEWVAELETATAAVPAGADRLHAYVEATMRMTADGKHSLATGLRDADLSPKSRDTIMAMHDILLAPLRTLLEEMQIPDAATTAMLVQGMINSGVQLVGHGVPAQEVTTAINEMLESGIRA
ncbi:TetR/AcrR family transcriptional regulator [Mycetocola zhujimingii]|uniref:TetR/AcrR family transcriptional regulator n=1 Tax=Mycetocola zhujimingii TaxID=2079792 RepID=A0A2U1TDC3_9MICO|nr:TetR/AcrR family transcriptional regulator [Mycetocola zhujimingii]PWC06773.1 TetR/AcrR family transcriptional regulator [Mycetocola zhujimingii]